MSYMSDSDAIITYLNGFFPAFFERRNTPSLRVN